MNSIKKYAYKHKPTNTWVFFKESKHEGWLICLGLKPVATLSKDPAKLKELLQKSSFNSIKNYGFDNFLEFELKTIK